MLGGFDGSSISIGQEDCTFGDLSDSKADDIIMHYENMKSIGNISIYYSLRYF